MIASMTGFGKGAASSPDKKFTVEIKSLNSKQLDLFVRIPSAYRECELPLRSAVAESLSRGKVEVSVTSENICTQVNTSVNVEVVEKYKEQIMEMATRLQIAWPVDWYSTLLRLPDALHTEAVTVTEEDVAALNEALTRALAGINEFRAQEGVKLEHFFELKLKAIGDLLEQVTPFEQARIAAIKERLTNELVKLRGIDYDKGRLEQELIFYIEKLDVTEEKTRLRAHIGYFAETMRNGTTQGKKLGFIAQEMGREINTLGSKSNDADMQRIVVKMKDELEQIKEQVLNVL
ncbi:MAG: YicC family protein [Lachnospiraceae bacterium]|nr:YicC family protein [Prevotella sp.]MCM1075179.1 YicC family protein [Ruminococcus sp.]MCM1223212.1 YicC family protein [Lachnospiraceae bacterium]